MVREEDTLMDRHPERAEMSSLGPILGRNGRKVKQLRKARKRVRHNNYNTPGTDGARNVSGTQRVDSEDDDSSYNSGCLSIVDNDNAANISSLNKNEPPSYPSSPLTRRSGRLLQD